MIGHVHALHALLPVTLRAPGQPDINIEFVIDTGFTDYLTLPQSAVTALGLPFLNDVVINLADDSYATVPLHEATILWHGVEQQVPVFATGKRPLLGTALLHGSEMVMQFADNGLVTIDIL
jgi:clan AA aspartic protease